MNFALRLRRFALRLSRFALRSMRARMTLGFAAAIALVMALVCGSLLAWTHHTTRRSMDALLDQSAREVAQDIQEKRARPLDYLAFAREQGSELRDPDAVLLVVDRGGRIVGQSQKHVPPWPLPAWERAYWRVRRVPWGEHTVVLAAPWREVRQHEHEFALALLALSLVVVAASGAGAWFLVGRTLSPIGHLAQQAERAWADDLAVRLSSPSPDAEVTGLVATLNGLLERQAQAAQAKGRFYAAASHELRTPLQALGGVLEWGLSRARPPEELERTLRQAQEQSNRLIALVRELLLLNQLDMATVQPPAQEVDVPDVAERLLAQLAPEIAARGLQVVKSWDDPAEIWAPAHHVEMLARNLIDNAVKYAAPAGRLSLSWRQGCFAVWNECEPVAGWDEGKYFEPFFRPDASRQSATGGNGLGLAICKALCASNGWQITLRQATHDFERHSEPSQAPSSQAPSSQEASSQETSSQETSSGTGSSGVRACVRMIPASRLDCAAEQFEPASKPGSKSASGSRAL